MQNKIEEISALIKACGAFIKEADRSGLQIDEKAGHANFVTEYDKKVEDMLKAGLLRIIPEAKFIGEEGEGVKYSPKGVFFIVDPIDGTTNFIKDYHNSCISVALIIDGEAMLAFVYNPYLDELFTAQKGMGAYCNGKQIHVSTQPLENGVVLFGTSPYHEELNEASFQMAYDYFKKALDIRRSGSAALDLCSVAAGRAELYFELCLSPWDHAAGGLIVKEAGGIVTDIDGNPVRYDMPCSILARNQSEKQR